MTPEEREAAEKAPAPKLKRRRLPTDAELDEYVRRSDAVEREARGHGRTA